MLNRSVRVIVLTAVLAGLAYAAPQPAPRPDDPVVAKVDGTEVHRSEVTRLLGQMPQQIQLMPMEQLYPLLLERLVDQKLIAAAGYKAKLQTTDDVKAVVRRAEEMAVQHAYMQQELKGKVTPAALDEAYKAYLAKNPPQDEVKAAHILVESEGEAKAVIKALLKGGDFAKLAGEKSKDTESAKLGGDLGYFTKDMMVEPFAVAAFAMKPGEVSKTPVKTDYGWHVIKLEDRRVKASPKFEEIKSELEETIDQDIVDAMVKKLRAKASVETFAIDGSPAPAKPKE
jgi:peptidyl-prolyl cis-trans isomerase C